MTGCSGVHLHLHPQPPPFPVEQQGLFCLRRDFPAYPPTFQPPRAGPGSCPSTRSDLLDQNLAFKVAGSDKQPRFKYLLELVETEALSLQLPSPRGAHHLPACSPFCLPPCHRVRSEISSNTWQPFPVRALLNVWVSGLRFGLKNVLSLRSWILRQLPDRSYSGLRPQRKLRFLFISVLQQCFFLCIPQIRNISACQMKCSPVEAQMEQE